MARKPKKRIQPELPEYSEEMLSKFSAPATDGLREGGGLVDELAKISQIQERFGEEWTDEEVVLLAKAMKKYPGGTPQRWEKIAEMVGRTVTEVTNKSKETKGGMSAQLKVNLAVQGSSTTNTKSQVSISDEIITQNSADAEMDIDDDYYYNTGKVRRRKKETKRTEKKLMVSQASESVSIVTPAAINSAQVPGNNTAQTVADESSADSSNLSVEVKTGGSETWTQNQQKILEWALKQYPKGTDRRWDRVAEHIPGKTKEECIARFKILAELISQKKKMEFASKTS